MYSTCTYSDHKYIQVAPAYRPNSNRSNVIQYCDSRIATRQHSAQFVVLRLTASNSETEIASAVTDVALYKSSTISPAAPRRYASFSAEDDEILQLIATSFLHVRRQQNGAISTIRTLQCVLLKALGSTSYGVAGTSRCFSLVSTLGRFGTLGEDVGSE